MDPIYILLFIGVLLLILAVVSVVMLSKKNDTNQQLAGQLEAMQNQQSHSAEALKQTIEDSLTKSRNETAAQNKERDEVITNVRERLAVIDQFKKTVEKLDDNVVGMSRIFENTNQRGLFGESQLRDIVETALPKKLYDFQYSVTNEHIQKNVRFDCYLRIPNPPGPIGVDSKFPLADYRRVIDATTDEERKVAEKDFKEVIKKYITDIGAKYIIPDVTSDFALMFIPSEAIFAEINKSMEWLIEESRRNHVHLVSPATMMMALNTMRSVVNTMEVQRSARKVIASLQDVAQDAGRLKDRTALLNKKLVESVEAARNIDISSGKIHTKVEKLKGENLELIDQAPEEQQVANGDESG